MQTVRWAITRFWLKGEKWNIIRCVWSQRITNWMAGIFAYWMQFYILPQQFWIDTELRHFVRKYYSTTYIQLRKIKQYEAKTEKCFYNEFSFRSEMQACMWARFEQMMIENKINDPLAWKSNKEAKLTDRSTNRLIIFKSHFKFELLKWSHSLFFYFTNKIWLR